MANAVGNNGGRLYSFASQPVLIDCNFVVDPSNGNGLGVRSLKGQGVQHVYMHTSATPAAGNPNPAAGYALIQLSSSYSRYLGGFSGFVSPVTGGSLNINSISAALVPGNPYVITSVGLGPQGQATISPVADVSGSLASTYFMLYDSYGNSFCVWFSVSGVGLRPNLGLEVQPGQRGLHYVQQSISSGDSAATIGAALVVTINALQSGIVGTLSFTASGTSVVTVVSTLNAPLSGIPQDGNQVIPQSNSQPMPIWFNISSGSASATSVWTDGDGNLYTVSATISSQTLIKTVGVHSPTKPAGVLTYVSGPGSTVALNYSSAVAGLATGFAFALTVSDSNLQDWRSVGVPPGVTPAVGVSFIATATGAGGSTGHVHAPGVSGIGSIEVIGDPNLSFSPSPTGVSANVGAWLLVQFLGAAAGGGSPVGPSGPAQPSLGNANGFEILAGSAFTNVGAGTVVTGDAGATTYTAFPPGTLIGTQHTADGAYTAGLVSLQSAINDIAARPYTVDMSGIDLGGHDLTPGVYYFSSSAALTGVLTLDAQNNPNAVFIFQIGSTLTTASASSVVLINGARPGMVYWQVGSSATLGTTTAFQGNILAQTAITVNNGASVLGRLQAHDAGISFAGTSAATIESTALVPVPGASGDTPTAPNAGSVCGMCFYVDARQSPSNIAAR